jgi:hypothetical protein
MGAEGVKLSTADVSRQAIEVSEHDATAQGTLSGRSRPMSEASW